VAPRCVSFDESLFGWAGEDQGPEAGGYHMFRIAGRSIAEQGPKRSDDQQPLWSARIPVDDRIRAQQC